jgi:DNA polymerase-3 subunit delta'
MHTVNLKPTEAEFKFGIIVSADRLNVQAANAFLKTLEEPPSKSILILLTTDTQRILETIISRCLRLNFAGEGQLMDAGLLAWLRSFSEQASAAQGDGLLGRYRLLGTLMARLAQTKEEIEKALTARSPLEKYDDVESSLREKWEDELTAAIEAEYRRQRLDLLAALQWWLRDVWLMTNARAHELAIFPDLAAAAQAVAKRITPYQAMENLEVLERTQRLLGSNVQEALVLEVSLLKLRL